MTNNEEFEKILENIDENGPEPQEEPERQYYFIEQARKEAEKQSRELGQTVLFHKEGTCTCKENVGRTRPTINLECHNLWLSDECEGQ